MRAQACGDIIRVISTSPYCCWGN